MPRTAIAAALIGTITVLGACSSDRDDPGTDPTGPGSTSAISPSDSPSRESTEPSVDPATGLLLRMPHASVHAPEGWGEGESFVDSLVSAQDDDTISAVTLGETEAYGPLGLDKLADAAIEGGQFVQDPKKLPTTDLDGVEVYHLAGKIDRFQYREELGAIVDDNIVTLIVQLGPGISASEHTEIVDSVTASVAWK